MYKKYGVVMQVHYSCLRNPNARMFKRLGADTGFDMIAVTDASVTLSSLLSKLDEPTNAQDHPLQPEPVRL